MAKDAAVHRNLLLVTTYSEFRDLVTAFSRGHYELMFVVGGPGIGKSEIVRRTMQAALGPAAWGMIKGKHTPLNLYERLYRLRFGPIVFDDLDDLLSKVETVMLLKCLCETAPLKRLEWGSSHRAFDGDLPQSFDSISRALLIANDLRAINKNIAAVFDRGLTISFQPSALEVHEELARAGWFDDEEVFNFIGRQLHLMSEPSLRFYITAREHKAAGLDWRSLTVRTLGGEADPHLILVAKLLADPQFDVLPNPDAARVRAFKDLGGSRATFYRRKAALMEKRGECDLARAAAVRLQPRKPDLYNLAMLDRRQKIEELHAPSGDEPRPDGSALRNDLTSGNVETLDRLRRQLQRAIAKEDYEGAAELRNRILDAEKLDQNQESGKESGQDN